MSERMKPSTGVRWVFVALGAINALWLVSVVLSGELAGVDSAYAAGTIVGRSIWIVLGVLSYRELRRRDQGISPDLESRPYVAGSSEWSTNPYMGTPAQPPACSATAPAPASIPAQCAPQAQPYAVQPQSYSAAQPHPYPYSAAQPQSYPAPEHRSGSVPPPGL